MKEMEFSFKPSHEVIFISHFRTRAEEADPGRLVY
jgi:hypothetical protein